MPPFPPSRGQIRVIAEDLKEEVAKRRKPDSLWAGGTVPSNFRPYFADVDPQGNFNKIFFKDGDQREFFRLSD